MSVTGKFNEFCEEVEDFATYIERLELYFIANAVTNDTKLAMFLTVIGPKTYGILKNLISPDKPSERSFEDLVKVLANHYMPKRSIIAERCKFNKRFQKEGESLAEYAVAIKQLASSCEYNTFLKDAIRDRFVSGMRDQEVQQRLLTEEDKTFDALYVLAIRLEEAKLEVKGLHVQEDVSDIHAVDSSQRHKSSQGKNNAKHFVNLESKDNAGTQTCFRCGRTNHRSDRCRFKNNKCFSCGRFGHLSNVCNDRINSNRSNNGMKSVNKNVHQVEEESDPTIDTDVDILTVVSSVSLEKSYQTSLLVENQNLTMNIDTGSAVSILPQHVYEEKFNHIDLEPSSLQLIAYSGHKLNLLGQFQANVVHHGKIYRLPLLVSAGSHRRQPVLLGRDWLNVLHLDWKGVHQVNIPDPSKKDGSLSRSNDRKNVYKNHEIELKNKYNQVFYGLVGSIKNIEAEIVIEENAVPVFCKARPVPYAMQEMVDKEIDNLIKNDIVYPVTQSDWATPLVCILKPDGKSVRLCADFKITLNKVIKNEHYPLPTPEDIFSKLAGGKLFSKIDLTSAYLQLKVGTKSQPLLTVSTHRGLLRFRKLPFGISNAPFAFQAAMDKVLTGLKDTFCYLDDILIVGHSYEDAVVKTEAALQKLSEYGIKANPDKSELLRNNLQFLGYRLSAEGISPSEHLVKAVVDAPEPSNVDKLRAYLGLINFYGKFLPNLSTVLHPLYELLQTKRSWNWSEKCKIAFQNSKSLLVNSEVLVPFDPLLPIQVTADASSYGLGAVMSHIMKNGTVRPIMFASRTLTTAEIKYAQVDKEGLAIIFAVKKFHKYLIARHFTLVTDHRPLLALFGERKAIPVLAAARMQRWAVILSAYNYTIVYKKGKEIVEADALSRLPVLDDDSATEEMVNFFAPFPDIPMSAKEIMVETRKDTTLARALDLTQHGWPEILDDPALKPYFIRCAELTVIDGCLLWGNRVIIPTSLRRNVLDMLHEEHPGICRMKALARGYVWWPNLDSDIERVVSNCAVCQSTRKATPEVQLQPWTWPNRRFYRIHLDFASKNGLNFLILTDSYSKWVDVYIMGSTNADKTIEKLRSCFASFGFPEKVVTDGGPPFQSDEFNNFLLSNGIGHIYSPAYHPKSNGQAESSVGTFKATLLKQVFHDKRMGQQRSIQHKVDCFLLAYRNTPHTTTGKTPAELFLGFKPRTRLTLLKPHLQSTVETNQSRMKANFDRNRSTRYFTVGQTVLVRSVRQEEIKWMPGKIKKVVSPMTYLVIVNGRVRFCHADHLKESGIDTYGVPSPVTIDSQRPRIDLHLSTPSLNGGNTSSQIHTRNNLTENRSSPAKIPPDTSHGPDPDVPRNLSPHKPVSTALPEEMVLRRSARIKRSPQKLNL